MMARLFAPMLITAGSHSLMQSGKALCAEVKRFACAVVRIGSHELQANAPTLQSEMRRVPVSTSQKR